jgi:hypothetical protein
VWIASLFNVIGRSPNIGDSPLSFGDGPPAPPSRSEFRTVGQRGTVRETAPASGRSRAILRGLPGEASITDRRPGEAIDGVKDSRASGAGSIVSTTRVARSPDRVAGEAARMRIASVIGW